MKKHFLFLAGSVLLLASSCGSNNNQAQQTQAQIDSTVNAKLSQHDAENAAKNDSTLKAMEAEKAATMSKEHEIRHEEHHANNNNNNNNAAAPATPAPTTPAPATNTRTNNAGPQSVNDRPGAH